MTKEEFEALAMRKGEAISASLYTNTIERYYMSDNYYHQSHGGAEETKADFVKRVFGGKINTTKTVYIKIVNESCCENRWALRGNPFATKDKLDNMDMLIAHQIAWEAAGETHSGIYNALCRAWEKQAKEACKSCT